MFGSFGKILHCMNAFRGFWLCKHACNDLSMLVYISASVELHSSLCKGKHGSTLQMVSTFEGMLTARPCIDPCLPLGSATIVMKGTRKQININSNVFRPESSGGTSHNCNH